MSECGGAWRCQKRQPDISVIWDGISGCRVADDLSMHKTPCKRIYGFPLQAALIYCFIDSVSWECKNNSMSNQAWCFNMNSAIWLYYCWFLYSGTITKCYVFFLHSLLILSFCKFHISHKKDVPQYLFTFCYRCFIHNFQ